MTQILNVHEADKWLGIQEKFDVSLNHPVIKFRWICDTCH